ncbi:MAG: HAD family hydrolase [Anaerolineae bacterium]|nr:HAD family hydrolase [Anaerolineae bacterium]
MRDWPKDNVVSQYRRAVFLDRDGTINVDTHYPHAVEDLLMIPGATEALEILAGLPLHIVIVSNQAGIPLGYFTKAQMSEFNGAIRSKIEQAKGRIDAFYFCPYLEPKNLPPGVTAHECSKPSPGMLIEASQDFGFDLAESFMVGDKTSDIAAGEKVGCVTILVRTGKAGKEEGAVPVQPTHHAEDILDAAKIIQSYFEGSTQSNDPTQTL